MRARVVVLASILCSSCIALSRIAPPVDARFESPGLALSLSIEDLHEGRRLYLSRCGRCHQPDPLESRSIAEWRALLPRMEAKARLVPEEVRLLRGYVEVARSLVVAPSVGRQGD